MTIKSGPVGGAGELTAQRLREIGEKHTRWSHEYGAEDPRAGTSFPFEVAFSMKEWEELLTGLAAKAPQGVPTRIECKCDPEYAHRCAVCGGKGYIDAPKLPAPISDDTIHHGMVPPLEPLSIEELKSCVWTSPTGDIDLVVTRGRLNNLLRKREAAAPKPAPPPERIAGPCDAEGLAEQYWHGGRRIALDEWVNERIENCNRIAAQKEHEDKEHWLEDAWYYEQIRQVLSQQNSTFAGPAPGAERSDIKALAKSLSKFVKENGYGGDGEWVAYLEEYQAENWLREALAAAPPAPTIERELRLRIHNIEKHNQYFDRCESGWCNPSKTCDPARGIHSEFEPTPMFQGDRTKVEGLQVAGRMEQTFAEHTRRLSLLIEAEQQKPLPDNVLIAAFCDSIRLAREAIKVVSAGDRHASAERVRQVAATFRKRADALSERTDFIIIQTLQDCAEDVERALPPSTGEKS